MAYTTIDLMLGDGSARLTLNRPDKLNSITTVMHHEVADALDTVESDRDIRVLVLTGAGRGFCAGQDLSDRKVEAGGEPADLGASVERYYAPLIRRLTGLPIPTIAAVNGVAAGAGANIALACDMVIAARSAKFIQSFTNIGLIPDSGGTWILPRLVGQARALGLALTARPLSADEAAAWGMIWECVDDDQLEGTVSKLTKRFASGATLGFSRTKALIRSASLRGLEEQLDHERDAMRELGFSDDYREGVTAFAEKRPAVFNGR